MITEPNRTEALTIRDEAELINQEILKRQASYDARVAPIYEEEFGGIAEELGLDSNEVVDLPELSNTRVKSVRHAVRADVLKQALRHTKASAETVLEGRESAEKILRGEDDRLIVVTGPCSIHDPEAAIDYAERLHEISGKFASELLIMMRVYLEKPRSEIGWKGLVNDPDLDNTTNVSLGLTMGRLLLLDITAKGIPPALERTEARTTEYFDDLSVYDVIGARNSETNQGRAYLSVTSAVGAIKNPTDGDLLVPAQAITTARAGHTYLGDGKHGALAEVHSVGNDTVHPVLRGGKTGPNYDTANVAKMKALLVSRNLPESLVIDASHSNSGKDAAKQIEVIKAICGQLKLGETAIKGVMIESNIAAGRQDLVPGQPLEYGKSITDACVDLAETERMFRMLAAAVLVRRELAKNRYNGSQA